MTDAFGIQLTAGTRIAYARERWASQSMREGRVVFIKRELAFVRLDGGGTGWAGRSQLGAVPRYDA